MNKYFVKVEVKLKPLVLDPQGKAGTNQRLLASKLFKRGCGGNLPRRRALKSTA